MCLLKMVLSSDRGSQPAGKARPSPQWTLTQLLLPSRPHSVHGRGRGLNTPRSVQGHSWDLVQENGKDIYLLLPVQ